jgi:hypothetical protein
MNEGYCVQQPSLRGSDEADDLRVGRLGEEGQGDAPRALFGRDGVVF